MAEKNRIFIFDTTLRDGEQSPGASMTVDEKIQMARQLVRLGVDVIEAGFPIASQGDFEAVSRIASEISGATIAGLARAKTTDIDRAYEALKNAGSGRIHTFLATSDIHLKYKLKMDYDQTYDTAVSAVKYARNLSADVEFSAEDATRSNWDFLCRVIEGVINAGARTVNIPDTVGYTIPQEYEKLIHYLIEKVPNIDKAIISVHCHNDLGLGVANSLAAVYAGARQVECTVNGIGERAGNTALEEVVMALRTRNDLFNATTGIDTTRIIATSKLLTSITGIAVQPNKAIVGENAFAHESGIHQDGMLKNPMTYEIMRPEDVGIQKSKLVLGKHSGRHAVTDRLKELGFELKPDELDRFFKYFKALADKKKEIYDEDLIAIIGGSIFREEEKRRYRVTNVQISTGMFSAPMTLVALKDHLSNNEEVFDVAHGNGGVDAGINAVKKITGTSAYIKSFNLVAITGGSDALSEVSVTVVEEVAGNEIKVFGTGKSIDISIAGILSFVDALNRLEYIKRAGELRKMANGDGL